MPAVVGLGPYYSKCPIIAGWGASTMAGLCPYHGRLSPSATRRRGSRAWPGHLQGGCRLQLRPPYKGATGCDRAPCKGWPSVAAAARKGRSPAGAAAARGHDQLQPARKGLSPVARLRCQPQGWPPLDKVTTAAQRGQEG
ncbi:hypothetical protein BHE74_00031669 [Ensete ventricosum]|nr:hypothetical protein BHE74_00031669 [Ensete ventricosum]